MRRGNRFLICTWLEAVLAKVCTPEIEHPVSQ